jgi:hypothetical protein
MNEDRRDEIEAWWALVLSIVASVVGIVVLLYAVFLMEADPMYRLAFALLGVGLMGRVIVASVVAAMKGSR